MSASFFESLETRQLMSASLVNGILTVTGTNLADILAVSQDATRVRVNDNGAVRTFALASVKSVVVDGLAGNDQLLGRSNLQKPLTLRGGEGNDTLTGGAKADTFEGGNGTDTADYSIRSVNLNISLDNIANDGAAGEGDNVKSDVENIKSGSGSDSIYGSSAANSLDAGAGADRVDADAGNDTIRGGRGNDTLSGGAGNDQILGEEDHDTIYGNINPLSLITRLSTRITGKYGKKTFDPTIRTFPGSFFGTDNDVISGGEGSDTVYASAGNDTVRGDGWADKLYGGDGNDLLEGGVGDDIIEAEAGNDTVWGDSAPSLLSSIRTRVGGLLGRPVQLAPSDVDVIIGGAGNDQLHGNGDGDTLSGGDDNDKLWGDAGNDVLRGNKGKDSLYGGDGNDNLGGDENDDVLVGIGGGNFDSLNGGTGSDQYWGDDVSTESYDADLGEILFGNVHKVASFVGGISKNLYGQNLADPNPLDNNGTAAAADDFTPVWNNFKSFPLFGTGGPRATDIRQGRAGSCYFLAPLAGMARSAAFRINQKVVELGDGTYAVEFRNNDAAAFVRVDADLPVSWTGSTTPYYAGLGAQNSVWAAIMEKAFCSIRGDGSYMGIGGGPTRLGFNVLSMREAGEIFDATSGTTTLQNIQSRLAQGQLVTLTTKNEAVPADIPAVRNHAYLVESVNTMRVWLPGTSGGGIFGSPRAGSFVDVVVSVTARNPWGFDGAGADANAADGLVTFTADHLQRFFTHATAAWPV